MNHEYEQKRASSPDVAPTASTDSYTVEPGQLSCSALLRKPEQATTSGLVQRKGCDKCSTDLQPTDKHTLAEQLPDHDAPSIHQIADRGMSGIAGTLPHLEIIQRSFGSEHDLSGVRSYVGGPAAAAAAAMGALAYAKGDQVAFAGVPSLHTASHEAAHVVQQRAGVYLKNGVGEAGDPYERNADEVADRVVRGLSAHDLLPASGGGSTQVQHQSATVQRQDRGARTETACSIEVCFASIRMGGLGRAGFVHAIVNSTVAGATQHAEVQPQQHQGVEDPFSGSVGGRIFGIHSHVAFAGGRASGTTCFHLTVTCAQAQAVRAAARRYESMDVVYNEPPGPNSNSFAEWVLTDAGISTAGITPPSGAWGWSYYVSNPGMRVRPPRVARTARAIERGCTTRVAKARSFRALVDLLRTAETQLITHGVTDVEERLHILRGIYYGTPWSRDFGTSERSHARTQMFNAYTGSTQPRYVMEYLDCGLVTALGRSQDVVDGHRKLDVGHMLIGMDARRSLVARNVPQPIGGVPGVEAATWVGDLGGGAARLAVDRTSTPRSALKYFRGSNYGGSINLEGDVASYAVGLAAGATGSGAPRLTIPAGSTISDTVEAYLLEAPGRAAGWSSRAAVFLRVLGGTLDASNAVTNRSTVTDYVESQVETFACWYLVNYLRQHRRLDLHLAEEASHHIVGTSREMAEVFVSALERSAVRPSTRIVARGPAPLVTPRSATSSCTIAFGAARGAQAGGQIIDWGTRQARDAGDWLKGQRRRLPW